MAYAVLRRYILVFNCDVYFILRKFEHGSNLKQRKGPKPPCGVISNRLMLLCRVLRTLSESVQQQGIC